MLHLALPLKSLPPRSAAFRSKLPAGGTGAGFESWYACNEGSLSLIKSGWFFDMTEAVLGCNRKLSRVIEARIGPSLAIDATARIGSLQRNYRKGLGFADQGTQFVGGRCIA